ncbi:MAG: AMP-dependent synthetase [Sulfobacillus benefaciens]|uniref:AMP-dependent synthetase n=1 Tax=Sulfobacillus benefaciens TaxID=453960 RepID=A0A2T2XJ05_9FIRM|nr:MAG: AMP-dependent synthetase [Sulfobacillus benefaciens]
MNRDTLTLQSLFSEALSRFNTKVALQMGSQEMTYGELMSQAQHLAQGLATLGATRNISVGLLMSNCFEYVIGDLAIMFCGATRVGLNDMLSGEDIQYILRDSEAHVLIVDAAFVPIVSLFAAALPHLQAIIVVGSEEELPPGWIAWRDFMQQSFDALPLPPTKSDDQALIIYTGGTTGLPKGVVHTQSAMVLNFLSHVIELGLLDDEVFLLMTPLPHSAGFLLNAGLLKGARIIVERRFNVEEAVQWLKKGRITLTFMVPTMIYRLLDVMETLHDEPMSISLRTMVYGAAPITVARLEQGMKWLGPVFLQLYGQSEAPDFITRLRKEDHVRGLTDPSKLASCGQPVMMAQVCIVNDQGNPVAPGEVGEVIAKTPYNMAGYLHLPEKTQEVLKDGWLYTGDMGYQDDDGYVYLVDRKKDIIITGGMNVYSSEVENVLQRCPGVLQVAVIGVPDEDWGETVLAVVVPDPLIPVRSEDILLWTRERLAKYKRPKFVEFVDALPVTAYGKIDKKRLRHTYWQGESRQIH